MTLYSVRSSLQSAASGTVPPQGRASTAYRVPNTRLSSRRGPRACPQVKSNAPPCDGRVGSLGGVLTFQHQVVYPHGVVVPDQPPAPPCPRRCRAGRTARQSSPAAPCAGPAARPATHRPAVRPRHRSEGAARRRRDSSRRWISANGFSSAAGKSRGRAER